MNRRLLLRSAFCLGLPALGTTTRAQENRIPLSKLELMFSEMRRNTKWNVDGPLLWGYFFVDSSRARLSNLAERLQADGYKLVELRPAVDSTIMHQLHVERIETPTPESLHARNAQLYSLVAELGVASYDGMDVGPVNAATR